MNDSMKMTFTDTAHGVTQAHVWWKERNSSAKHRGDSRSNAVTDHRSIRPAKVHQTTGFSCDNIPVKLWNTNVLVKFLFRLACNACFFDCVQCLSTTWRRKGPSTTVIVSCMKSFKISPNHPQAKDYFCATSTDLDTNTVLPFRGNGATETQKICGAIVDYVENRCNTRSIPLVFQAALLEFILETYQSRCLKFDNFWNMQNTCSI